MTLLKRTALIVCLNACGLGISGQTTIPEARIERLAPMPRVITQPIVVDSALLLNAPWLVWRCTYEKRAPEVEWFDADLARVQSCAGKQESYELVANNRSHAYKLRNSTERARLTRTSDSTFHYVEFYFTDSESVHQYQDLVYDALHPRSVDTLYYEDPGSGEMRMLVTRFVVLRGVHDDTSETAAIDAIVQEIDKTQDYMTKTLENEEFLTRMTDGGGELTGWMKNGDPVRIVERVGLSSCVNVTEYYFDRSQLVYVSVQGSEFAYSDSTGSFDPNVQHVSMEARFYFKGKDVISVDLQGSTRCGGAPTREWVSVYQTEALRLRDLLMQ
jgi:hypothetical protein